MRTEEFYYELPHALIAQSPLPERETSRLLVYERSAKRICDQKFSDIPRYFHAGDVLVRNTTRVIPARLHGKRVHTGGTMEFLLLRNVGGGEWEALVKPGRRARAGQEYTVSPELSITICADAGEGKRIVRLHCEGEINGVLQRAGETPLPPYITEPLANSERYQTVYAKENGSCAAPTAGLHFTEKLFRELADAGVQVVDILLHVGLGTFRLVTAKTVEDHQMHAEYFEITEAAATAINGAKQKGGRVFAVGTTVLRSLESAADEKGLVRAAAGWTDIFITPGHSFRMVDALITNFHLPESTLLMLVGAFVGMDAMQDIYAHAIAEKYRFYSFGDASLLL